MDTEATGWHDILTGCNFCDFSSVPQKNIPANIFPAKIYSEAVNILYLEFAFFFCKKCIAKNVSVRVCNRMTEKSNLFCSVKHRATHTVLLLENITSIHALSKNENVINDLFGTFWKSQKVIPSKKDQSVLTAIISFCKTRKIANPQNELSRESWHTVVLVHYSQLLAKTDSLGPGSAVGEKAKNGME